MQKALKKRKKQHEEELCAFENMNASDSDEEFINISSKKEEEIKKIGSDEILHFNSKHSSTK